MLNLSQFVITEIKKKLIQKSSEINKILLTYVKGFPGDSVVKNLPTDAGDGG